MRKQDPYGVISRRAKRELGQRRFDEITKKSKSTRPKPWRIFTKMIAAHKAAALVNHATPKTS